MAHPDFSIPPPRQAHDISRFLDVCRQGLFDEDVASRLECVHGEPIMRKMGGEDGEGVGFQGVEHFSMVGKRRGGGGFRLLGGSSGEIPGGVDIGVGAGHHGHLVASDQAVEMDPGGVSASGDRNSQLGMCHQIRASPGASPRWLSNGLCQTPSSPTRDPSWS